MSSFPLKVTKPTCYTYVTKKILDVTPEQRERVLKATHYNEFAFPAHLLTIDMLSDSGTTAMTDVQWSALMLGDEAYGRNRGYFVLEDALRDVWERGDKQKRLIDLVTTDCQDVEKLIKEMYLVEISGGLFNGGAAQMERPNTFLVPQGRCAESLLFSVVSKILNTRFPGKNFTIPSNGHFDTTEGNIKQMGSTPRNLYDKDKLWEVPEGGKYKTNPFKGNMDTKKLEELILEKKPENVPMVYTTITNNTVCGQPVSMANMRESSRIAHKYNIPFMLDAARWAENCYFIKKYEEGYQDKSIFEIAKEMFSYCDGFTASLKKDGHANMGGVLAFRDKGLFWKNFSDFNEDGSVKTDVGITLKVKQISCYGNDSYGAMSGRDILALAAGLYEAANFKYLEERVSQCEYLAQGFYKHGIPVVLPAGGHGVYINMDKFFDYKRDHDKFAGQGFSMELIRRYGIRTSELGDYSMEYDLKTPEQQKEVCNVVRFAINRSQLNREHLDYVIAAVAELYKDRENIPNMRIVAGRTLPMRHFHAFLEPYPNDKSKDLCESKPEFKIHYFKGNGRGALIRAILSYEKISFENDAFEHSEWEKIKNSGLCEYGQVPVLEHRGKKLAQSVAIYKYLAKFFDLGGEDIDEEYQIDNLLGTIDDLGMTFYKIVFPQTEEDKKNPEKVKKTHQEKLERYLEVYEKKYASNGNKKYFLGDNISLADFFLAVELNIYAAPVGGDATIKAKAPKIFELIDRMKKEELKEFFEKYYISN